MFASSSCDCSRDSISWKWWATRDSEEDAVQAISVLRPDVVLLDLNLQVGSGMHVLRRARAGGYTGKLWVLSSRDPDFYRSLCEKHGADGFYDKAHEQLQLLDDLRVLAGEKPLF
ncbi:response regulator [Roseateles sp. UC29_93]|uniref:response regulator n=1 Tax=Roseateles sp. UC29_93 TaxID=3350177 RepID=UPI00366A7A47